MSLPGSGAAAKRHRVANILVLVALALMLLGTIAILAARDTFVVDLAPGEEATVFRYETPSWDHVGHPMKATIFASGNATASGNITLNATEATGRGASVSMSEFVLGRVPDWSVDAGPGEDWTLTVHNGSEEGIRVSATISHDSAYLLGGILVALGVLGFVFYRIGMKTSHGE